MRNPGYIRLSPPTGARGTLGYNLRLGLALSYRQAEGDGSGRRTRGGLLWSSPSIWPSSSSLPRSCSCTLLAL